MNEQTRLEDQEKRLQYETELKLLSDSLLSLSAKSVRGLITIDEIILHSFECYLVALSQFVKAYPDGLENHYLQKYNEVNSVLSALCSLALDNPDEDAYKIISEYKNS